MHCFQAELSSYRSSGNKQTCVCILGHAALPALSCTAAVGVGRCCAHGKLSVLFYQCSGVAGATDDGQEAHQPKQPSRQMSGGASPALRARSGAMDDQHQHIQQQQQQQHQQFQHQLHQQLQQQHSHVISADAMQMQNGVMHMSTSPCFTGQAPGIPHNIFMQPGPGL